MNRYSNIKQIRNLNEDLRGGNSLAYKGVKYPTVPLDENDIYVITEFGDRLDILAQQFYKDVTLYWIISIANPDIINFGSLSILEGSQIRIPTNLNSILTNYKLLNGL